MLIIDTHVSSVSARTWAWLDSPWNFFSWARLSSWNFSSNSSLGPTYYYIDINNFLCNKILCSVLHHLHKYIHYTMGKKNYKQIWYVFFFQKCSCLKIRPLVWKKIVLVIDKIFLKSSENLQFLWWNYQIVHPNVHSIVPLILVT